MAREDRDLLAVVEAAYQVDAPDDAWLVGVATAALPLLDEGFGLCAFEYVRSPDGLPEIARSHMMGVPPGLAELHSTIFRTMPPEIRQRPFRMGPYVTGSQLVGDVRAMREHPHMKMYAQKFGMYDSIWITATEPSGHGCGLHAGRPTVSFGTAALKQRWGHIAAHLAAAARLRHRLKTRLPEDVHGGVDAIIDPNGRVHDANGPAREAPAREALRRAVVTLEKLRGPRRFADPDDALRDWKALVMGRWSLVDHMEHDGHRYVVARENEPTAGGPAALTGRERQVIGYARLGHHNKLIAYELGISHSTVRVLLARAAKRLQVRTREELIEACAQTPEPAPPRELRGAR